MSIANDKRKCRGFIKANASSMLRLAQARNASIACSEN
jgi:hypothetical protein